MQYQPCREQQQWESTGHVGHVWSIQKGWQLETSINKKTVKYKIKEAILILGYLWSLYILQTHAQTCILYIYIHTHIIIEPYEYIIIYNYIPTESLSVYSYSIYIYVYIIFYQNIIIDISIYIYVAIVNINSYILNTSNSYIFHNIQLTVSCIMLIFIDI